MEEYEGKIMLNQWFIDHQVRNTSYNDTLLDYLEMYGTGKSIPLLDLDEKYTILKDNMEPTFEPSIEFTIFNQKQKQLFFKKIIQYIGNKIYTDPNINKCIVIDQNYFCSETDGTKHMSPIIEISQCPKLECDRVALHTNTLAAMQIGFPLIVNGILHDRQNETIVLPELLIRKDILPFLFNNFQTRIFTPPSSTAIITSDNANDKNLLDDLLLLYKYTYVPVNVRWAINEISKKNVPQLLTSSNGGRYFEALLLAQTMAIKNLTGHTIPEGYVIGKGWKCDRLRNMNAFDAPATINCHFNHNPNGLKILLAAKEWMKLLKSQGHQWELIPKPSVIQLYPNMKNAYHFPWHNAKYKLAHFYKELTCLWHVGVSNRNMAIMKGISSFEDKRLTIEALALQPHGKISTTLKKIIRSNQYNVDDLIKCKNQYMDDLKLQKKEFKEKSKEIISQNIITSSIMNENKEDRDKNVAENAGQNQRIENFIQVRPFLTSGLSLGESITENEFVKQQIENKTDDNSIIDINRYKNNLKRGIKRKSIEPVDQQNKKTKRTASNKSKSKSNVNNNNIILAEIEIEDDIQKNPCDLMVRPLKFKSKHKEILKNNYKEIEFVVDFETKPSIDIDDRYMLHTFPRSIDTSMISMIGMGYEDPKTNKWIAQIFKTDRFIKSEEIRIIDQWIAKMKYVTQTYQLQFPDLSQNQDRDQDNKIKYKIFHWSKAEQSFLINNYNSAVKRHNRPDWGESINWIDLHQICRDEGFTVPGSFNFSLKSIVKALYKLGLIDKIWTPSPIEDGMCAAIALISCGKEAEQFNKSMSECKWMPELENYLHLDIATVYAILNYLRRYHL